MLKVLFTLRIAFNYIRAVFELINHCKGRYTNRFIREHLLDYVTIGIHQSRGANLRLSLIDLIGCLIDG